MENLKTYILAILLLTCCTNNSELQEVNDTNVHKNLGDPNLIKNIIVNHVDSCEVFAVDQILNINIYSPPKQINILERNMLFCDSIIYVAVEKIWNYKSLKFHFIADTTLAEDKAYLDSMIHPDPDHPGTEISEVLVIMDQDNLLSKANKFNSPNYMKMFRIILNDCTIDELLNYQKAINIMNSIGNYELGKNFIQTVMDLGFKLDHDIDYSFELRTIKKMVEVSDILKEVDVKINEKILMQIINTANNK